MGVNRLYLLVTVVVREFLDVPVGTNFEVKKWSPTFEVLRTTVQHNTEEAIK